VLSVVVSLRDVLAVLLGRGGHWHGGRERMRLPMARASDCSGGGVLVVMMIMMMVLQHWGWGWEMERSRVIVVVTMAIFLLSVTVVTVPGAQPHASQGSERLWPRQRCWLAVLKPKPNHASDVGAVIEGDVLRSTINLIDVMELDHVLERKRNT
jgi:hypothetical protein